MHIFKTNELPVHKEPAPGGRIVRPVFDKNDFPDTPVSISYVRLEQGVRSPEHIHDGGIEAILVLEGKCTMRVGEEIKELVADDLLYVPQNIEHETWNDNAEPVLLLCIFGPSNDYSMIRGWPKI